MKTKALIVENETVKSIRSKSINFDFNKKTGFTATWGKTLKDDPDFCEYGPMIADIEVTTSCKGTGGKLCKFCYKSNTPNGKNMSFDTFKKIFDKLPRTLTQIAVGADSQATSNPDLFKMMEYSRKNGVVPNITVAEISDEVADKLSELCGAVAVSRYEDKNICYNSLKKLTNRGMNQTNVHIMVSEESYDNVMETIKDSLIDERLSKLNAIVLLSLKKKGRGEGFTPLSEDKFKNIVDFSLDNNVSIGFDSCSAYKFLSSVKNREDYKMFEMVSEPCESSLFSSYFNVDGMFFPCSFTEGCKEWEEGLSASECVDFIEDIWMHPRVIKFRNKLLETVNGNSLSCRECPYFKI